jgi:membrane peptidoglycan carboxypeptidase
MRGRIANFIIIVRLLGALTAASVVLGLLGAGLLIPAAGATGAVARKGVHAFDSLPSDFTQTPLSQRSRILAADGSVIAIPYEENRIIVPLAKIAPVMRQAQVAIEDSRFYEHGGVDLQAVGRAVVSNLRSGITQGASTLTQQYVKITLQENALRKKDTAAARAATAKSYTRKLQELKYAVGVEKNLTKNQILEGYLNIVYFGDQAYGVEAAANHYFGVTAARLSLAQAATLAGLVQRPSETDPIHHPTKALDRRNVVLDQMHSLNMITDTAWQAAKNTKMVTSPKTAQGSCALSPYPYFCTYVMAWLMEQPTLGKTTADRLEAINRGGLTIQTTLNPKMQRAAQRELVAKVPIGNGAGIGAAAAIVEPGTGHVMAIAQNTAFAVKNARGKTAVNWAVDARYGGSGGFAFGSTAKMFAVAQALRTGMTTNSIIIARKADPTHAAFFLPHEFKEKACEIFTPWGVHNDEGTRNGPITLTDAAAFSVNTAFAGLVARLGPCAVRDLMTKMGLHKGSGGPITPGPSAVTLGSDSTSPLTLASAYATVAAGGIYCVPSPVLTISDSNHKKLALPKNKCTRAIEPDIASGVTKILKTVLTRGTGSGTGGLDGGRPAAGKTGTSEGSNETWFVGYTPQLCTAVWVGTPNDYQNRRNLRNIQLGDRFYYGQIFGATIAAPAWKGIMDRASAGMPFRDFSEPSDKLVHGDLVSVPFVAGLSVGQAIGVLASAGFTPVVGNAVSSNIPVGRVVFTQPGFRALRGSAVVIYTSSGVEKPRPTTAPAIPPKPIKAKGPGRG